VPVARRVIPGEVRRRAGVPNAERRDEAPDLSRFRSVSTGCPLVARPSRGAPPRRQRGATPLVWMLLVLAFFGVSTDAWADAFDVKDTTWEGCSELLDIARAELGAARVQAVGVLNWEAINPEDGVLVLHPEQLMDQDETAAFMKAGGRLAIVDDYGRGDETLRRFHIERTGVPSRPVAALRNKAALAIAEPVLDVSGGHAVGPHPVVSNVKQLVTNHPTGLKHPNLSPVLRIRAIGEPDAIIAVAGQVGKGRLFAMSDPSALMNQMLRYPGNRAFVAGLARYLVDDDGTTRRQGRLFIVSNRFGEEGAFGGETSLKKDLETQLRALANALADARRDGFPTWMHLAIAALATLGLAIWVARASARPYKSTLPRYARPTPLVAQGGVAGRFALIAAPSSPRSLALLELKSALFEAIALKFELEAEPSPERLARLVRQKAKLDDGAYSAFKGMLSAMQRVETSVVAGRPVKVPRTLLAEAAKMSAEVLSACGADAPHRVQEKPVAPSSAAMSDGDGKGPAEPTGGESAA